MPPIEKALAIVRLASFSLGTKEVARFGAPNNSTCDT